MNFKKGKIFLSSLVNKFFLFFNSNCSGKLNNFFVVGLNSDHFFFYALKPIELSDHLMSSSGFTSYSKALPSTRIFSLNKLFVGGENGSSVNLLFYGRVFGNGTSVNLLFFG